MKAPMETPIEAPIKDPVKDPTKAPIKAMILAAGLGTRLRPLTDDRPKALVEVGGRTMLEITLARLRSFGVHEVIINVHYFADMVADYLKANDNFGMHVEISRETVLLDTGGGLKKAAHFFLRDAGGETDQPFLLHNVDVISTIDLRQMLQFHVENRALVTLAVQERETSRYLLFDERGELCGRSPQRGRADGLVRPAQQFESLAFTGIHVISTRLLGLMTEEACFSIIDSYLRLAGRGEKLLAFRADRYYWRDLGKPHDLRQVERELAQNILPAPGQHSRLR
jgi:NDP-sugar pyrophosphorylase family protein